MVRKIAAGGNLDVRVRGVLASHGLSQAYYDRVVVILSLESDLGLPRNAAVFDPKLLDYAHVPWRGPKLMAGLILMWDRDFPDKRLTELSLSPQTAGLVSGLKKLGFVFGRSLGQAHQFVLDAEGNKCRKIVGLNPDVVPVYKKASAVGNCCKTNVRLFKVPGDPYDGEKKAKKLEIGHRMPVNASVEVGREHPQLDDDMVRSGMAHIFFRPESTPTNDKKREVCRRCLRGETIEVPPVVPRAAYKDHWDETCVGCYWHNPATPQYPEKYTLLELQKTVSQHEEQGMPADLKGKVSPESFWDEDRWSLVE